MKTLQEKIAVMQAAADGKAIEIWDRVEWIPCPAPRWDWVTADYRVVNTPITLAVQITHEGVNALSSRVTAIYNPDVIRLRLVRGESMVLKFVEAPK